jgi:hypothetical protein
MRIMEGQRACSAKRSRSVSSRQEEDMAPLLRVPIPREKERESSWA